MKEQPIGQNFIAILNEIVDLEPRDSFMLAGFHISGDEIASIESLLTPDDPDVGAVGRYDGSRLPFWGLR